MFIAKNNDLIILAKDTREELEKALQFIVYTSIEETNVEYQLYGGEYLTPEEVAQKERERIMRLSMTPLDFLKALSKIGITYETVKQIMEANPEIEMEMRFCQNVYRGHPMIVQFAEQYGVSSDMLDHIFKVANGEEE